MDAIHTITFNQEYNSYNVAMLSSDSAYKLEQDYSTCQLHDAEAWAAGCELAVAVDGCMGNLGLCVGLQFPMFVCNGIRVRCTLS